MSDLCNQYGIRSVPTLLYFENGKIKDRDTTASSKNESKLKSDIKSIFGLTLNKTSCDLK